MDDAIRAWNPWWETHAVPSAQRGRSRGAADALVQDLQTPHVLVLGGVRRAGKTTLLYQLVDHLLSTGVPSHDILFLNLEDPALRDVPTGTLLDLHPTGTPGPRRFVFLDEVQVREDWERHVLVRYERKEPVKFVASGSSSDLLMGRHATVLTGRNLTRIVRPLTFAEFVAFQPPSSPLQPQDVLLGRFLGHGGFPEVVTSPGAIPREILQHYFEDILNRDVQRHGGIDLATTRRLGLYLAETFARPHTQRALARAVGIASHETLTRHLDALRRAFLIHSVAGHVESPKPHLQALQPSRYYWVDGGLRNALVRNPGLDVGRQAENVVANELVARCADLRSWTSRDRDAEVDFLAFRGDGRVDAYQVCYGPDLAPESLPPREWMGLEAVQAVLGKRLASATILTTRAAPARHGVQVVALHEWLLALPTGPGRWP